MDDIQNIEIKETDCFGLINKDSISFDDQDYFGDSFLLFEFSKIKCYTKGNQGIIGIQLIYKYREDQKEYTTINSKKNENCTEQEFIFKPKETIINIIIFRKNYSYFQGFEITTNLNRSYRFGVDNGEKIMLNEFSSGKNMVVGFYGKFDNKIGITALGFYYISRKIYSVFLFSGLFYLRAKIQNKQFLESIEKNFSNLDYESKAVFNVSILPKNNFMEILKYIID